jgi:hypothetical protein
VIAQPGALETELLEKLPALDAPFLSSPYALLEFLIDDSTLSPRVVITGATSSGRLTIG